MFRKLKNNRKSGFTLIEIVVALAIVVILGGFTITSLSVIPQMRMRQFAQTFKSEFELTRNFAKTHGGDAEITIKKVDGGVEITRTGANLTPSTEFLKDGNLVLYYKLTGDESEYKLGEVDSTKIEDSTIMMTFAQTNGSIIGPHMLDYVILSNGSRNFKFFIKQSTGMIYYDYELEDGEYDENIVTNDVVSVNEPTFILKGAFVHDIQLKYTGSSLQPEINYDAMRIRISGVYRAIEKDRYTIVFSLKDPYSTKWADGTIDDKELHWEIIP